MLYVQKIFDFSLQQGTCDKNSVEVFVYAFHVKIHREKK